MSSSEFNAYIPPGFILEGNNFRYQTYTDSGNYYQELNSPLFQGLSQLSSQETLDSLRYYYRASNNYLLDKAIPIPDNLNYIGLRSTFPKISAEELSALIHLYEDFAFGSNNLSTPNLEVGVCLLYHEETNVLRFLVHNQRVTQGSVDWQLVANTFPPAEKECYWLVTGEKTNLSTFSAGGWKMVGTSHSHNTMALSEPSAQDDLSEVVDSKGYKPLALHILFSCFKKQAGMPDFQVYVSISHEGSRWKIPASSFNHIFEDVSEEQYKKFTYNKNCLSVIQYLPSRPGKLAPSPYNHKATYPQSTYYNYDYSFDGWLSLDAGSVDLYTVLLRLNETLALAKKIGLTREDVDVEVDEIFPQNSKDMTYDI